MTYDPDDLGLDMERAKALPECAACRKKSDGFKIVAGIAVCGAHYDEWMATNAAREAKRWPRVSIAEFALGLREGHFKACWEATIDE